MRKSQRAYKLNKTLVSIGTNTGHDVDDFTKGATQLYELLFRALFWKVSEVHHLRWHSELLLSLGRHSFIDSEGTSHVGKVNEQNVGNERKCEADST